MKLTTKTRYSIIFLLKLAVSYESEKVESISDIAQKENISPKFLEQIVAVLKTKGLIYAQRGAKGGYRLSRPPDQIDLRTIFEIVQGPLFEEAKEWPNPDSSAQGIVRNFTEALRSNLTDFLGSKKLEGLVRDYQKKNSASMFYI